MGPEDAEALWQYRKQFTVWRKALKESFGGCGQALMVSWQENERGAVPAEVVPLCRVEGCLVGQGQLGAEEMVGAD